MNLIYMHYLGNEDKMDREIKFRAWSEHHGMIYSNYAIVDPDLFIAKFGVEGNGFWCHPETHAWLTYFIRSDYKFLMQYTGLRDKKGKEIFEGDILKFYSGRHILCLVEWDKDLPGFTLGNWYEFDFPNTETESEVVGNIYENKELLKELK